jgi:uncharacterized glyoxalase superfamily protein PhnB
MKSSVRGKKDLRRDHFLGMLVDNVDAMHRRALDHGAAEVSPPADYAWKPRSSVIDDPSGNRIQLSQA